MDTKIIILTLLTIACFTSCGNRTKEKSDFELFFNKKIEGLYITKELYEKDTIIQSDSCFFRYIEDIYYLEHLSNCDLKFMDADGFIIYQNIQDIQSDINDLTNWYDKNKDKMTIEKADSIVKRSYINIENEKLK